MRVIDKDSCKGIKYVMTQLVQRRREKQQASAIIIFLVRYWKGNTTQWKTLFSTSWKPMITKTSSPARKKPLDSKPLSSFTTPPSDPQQAASACGPTKTSKTPFKTR